MKGFWARLTGRVRVEQAERSDEPARMTPAGREAAEEPAIERAVDAQLDTMVEGDADPDDPDGPDKLLTGLGS